MISIVVSENEMVRKKIRTILNEYEMVECNNFLDALIITFQNQYNCNIIIADYNLDSFDGIVLLECIKKINDDVKTVLLISTEDEEVEIERLKDNIDLIIEHKKPEKTTKAYIEKLLLQVNPKSILKIKENKLLINDIEIELTSKELGVINMLIENEGNVISREEILHKVWKQEEGNIRKIDINVKAIRSKLKANGLPNYIAAVSGLGYRWESNI